MEITNLAGLGGFGGKESLVRQGHVLTQIQIKSDNHCGKRVLSVQAEISDSKGLV